MEFKLEIGVDIGKPAFDTAHQGSNGKMVHRTWPNNSQGISKFIHYMQALGPAPEQILVCMEYTGVYIEKITQALVGEGFFVWVVNPFIIKTNAVGLVRIKSDKADAKKICLFAQLYKEQATAFKPKTAIQDQIASLFRLRRQLVKGRQVLLNQQVANKDKASPCIDTIMVQDILIENYTELIQGVEKALRQTINRDERLSRIYQILSSIPCIGPVTASNMIILTEGFTKINNWRAFACFIGTAPFENTSADKKLRRTKVSKFGHRSMKTIMNMGVLRQIGPDGFFRDLYQHMINGTQDMRPKHHLSAMNAIKNKVIKLAFDLVKIDQLFDPEIFRANQKKHVPYLGLS